MLIRDPDVDILQMLPKANKTTTSTLTLWDKTQIGVSFNNFKVLYQYCYYNSLQTKKVAGKVLSATSSSSIVTTTIQQKPLTTTAPISVISRFPNMTIKTRGPISSNTRISAPPRLIAQAEKNSVPPIMPRNPTSNTTAVLTLTRGTTKVITTTATQTFAAKLTETTTSQLMVTVSQGVSVTKPRISTNLNVHQQNVGPISPQNQQATIITSSSPKHHRPAPSGSAPPNIQHYSNPGKIGFQNPAAQTTIPKASEHSSNIIQQSNVNPMTSQVNATVDDNLTNHAATVQTTQEYSLFNSKSMAQQSMWRPENESQKPINFAAVTGGNNTNSNNQINIPPQFIDEQPQQVDASKAPGYRGTAVCSPVSSKTSSNSTTPPNMPLSSSYQAFPEQKPLPPIGSTIYNRTVSQANPNDLASTHYYTNTDLSSRSVHMTHADNGLYKTGVANYNDNNAMLNMSSNDNQPMMQYHQGNTLQHLTFTQSQQPLTQPVVSMSRLNPKAPDFSSNMHTMPTKGPQIYNGYNQNTSNIYPMNKPVLNNYARTPVAAPANRWVMPMQPFTQPNELISGMSGMTLHNIGRVNASDMLHENGGELVVTNNSPAMSPNISVPHQIHANEGNHYLEDRKPQPIGTERARKSYNPTPEWLLNNESKMMVNRWVGSGGNLDRISMPRTPQLYDNFNQMIDSFQVHISHRFLFYFVNV